MIIDIYSGSKNRIERTLSNLHENPFVFDGVSYKCMEAFLQSLKCKSCEEQLFVSRLNGPGAYRYGQTKSWKEKQTLYFKGVSLHRMSDGYSALVYNAYLSMLEQSKSFRDSLRDSYPHKLVHTMGHNDPSKTILTENEFCGILTELRQLLIEE